MTRCLPTRVSTRGLDQPHIHSQSVVTTQSYYITRAQCILPDICCNLLLPIILAVADYKFGRLEVDEVSYPLYTQL